MFNFVAHRIEYSIDKVEETSTYLPDSIREIFPNSKIISIDDDKRQKVECQSVSVCLFLGLCRQKANKKKSC